MPSGGNETPEDELLKELVARQASIDKRVERLESLEGAHKRDGLGCIEWLDYDSGASPFQVDVPAPDGALYSHTHLTVFYGLSGAAGNTIRMTINNIVAANYGYNYSYSVGSGVVETAVGADGQTSMAIARLISANYVVGWFHIPLFPVPMNVHTYGDWVGYDTEEEAGSQVERGKFGGVYTSGANRVLRIDIFPSGGGLNGYVLLYGWCPRWSVGVGPVD